jgi:cellobiose epimerase
MRRIATARASGHAIASRTDLASAPAVLRRRPGAASIGASPMTRRTVLSLTLAAGTGLGAADSPRPPAAASPDPAQLAACRQRIETELRGDILPYWRQHAPDPATGGFVGLVDNDGTVHPGAARGALLSARILWTFSAAFERYRDPADLAMARRAAADLIDHFRDPQDGALFWTITADGKPLNTGKILYVQSFGIYGFSEFFRATGDRSALDQAIALYRLVEAHCRDHVHGGYYEEFTRDWTLQTDMHRSVMGSEALKSQNTHLHLLEAYTNLYRVWPDPGLRRDLHDLVEVMLTHIINPATHHLWLFLDADWKPRSDVWSFGHDIEASRLLPEAAEALGDPALLTQTRAEALQMARVTLAEGVDTDGGLLSEAGPHGLVNTNKEWWQQAEALTGFLHAYQLSGDPRFLQASLHGWDFIAAHFIDTRHGGWYRLLKRDDTVISQDKISLWKCPYHNGRACMEMIDRLGALLPEKR